MDDEPFHVLLQQPGEESLRWISRASRSPCGNSKRAAGTARRSSMAALILRRIARTWLLWW